MTHFRNKQPEISTRDARQGRIVLRRRVSRYLCVGLLAGVIGLAIIVGFAA